MKTENELQKENRKFSGQFGCFVTETERLTSG